jgi:formylmethanofuran dehydrogenase subunit B
MSSAVTTAADISDVTCPFCGLLCDDLAVRVSDGGITVQANGCRLANAGFQAPIAPGEARLGGRAVSLAEAVREAATLLRQARQPLFGGLGTDVEGIRATARLADRCGAVVDHMNSAAGIRNLLVLQDGGWITTTLSEIRNRADLLVVLGGDVTSRFPRFFERCIANPDTLFGANRSCDVVFLGRGLPAGAVIPGVRSRVITFDVTRLHEGLGVMRALYAGRNVDAPDAAGVPISVWQELLERMKTARYGVAAWAAADLEFPHAELTIQALCELIKDLNRETRFAGLPLGGTDGDVTADNVLLWQSGYGTRTAYGSGGLVHDPHLHSTARLLADGADLLLWISSFSAVRIPPETAVPRIVLGRPGMTFSREPEVFIAVGTPGLDHAGHLFRTDRVPILPLQRLRDGPLTSVAAAIMAIESAL